MIAHLHLHLEPSERKRRLVGALKSRYSSSAQFFAEHDAASTHRVPVTWDELVRFIADLHLEQRSQGVDHVELRFSPRRLLGDTAGLPDLLERASQAVACRIAPTIRLILLINRDSSAELIDACESAITDGLPPAFVGVDVAGDELRFPDARKFARCLRAARSAGLGVTVHAGEFGPTKGIWDALDLLGATRIGHGVSAGRSRALAARLRRDQIMIETSVSSNLALGSVPSLAEHPLPWFLDQGIPVCLNADVPLHIGTDLAAEWELASVLIGHDRERLDSLRLAAARYRFERASPPPGRGDQAGCA